MKLKYEDVGGRKMIVFCFASVYLLLVTFLSENGEAFKLVLETWKWVTGFFMGANAIEHIANSMRKP